VLFISCSPDIKDCSQVKNREITLFKNIILNGKSEIVTETINDEKQLNKICSSIFKYNKFIKYPAYKTDTGFVEVRFSDNNELYFYIIYSQIDGPVIELNRRRFKNDSLLVLLNKIDSSIPLYSPNLK